MSNQRFSGCRLEDGPHDWRRAIHMGWTDAINGAGWHPESECMSIDEQIGYEIGRLFVHNIILARIPVPQWNGSKSTARDIEPILAKSIQLVGNPIPSRAER